MNAKVFCLITSFLIGISLDFILIPILTKFKFGQNIREIGPKWHKNKVGTPTMGGIIFILSSVISTCIWQTFNPLPLVESSLTMLLLFTSLAFGLIGTLDDIIKIKRKQNAGLSAAQKYGLQLFVAAIFLIFAKRYQIVIDILNIPKIGSINLGVFFAPILLFIITGCVNSVNLTDGLDGLASSVSLIILIFLSILSSRFNHVGITNLTCALIGGLLSFLLFNKYPARVFMGDCGSLFLGGYVGAISTILGVNAMLPIFGICYVIETLSVIIQVFSFKLTGKRIFKMSPLHHHFEMCGFSESKIVWMFSIFTLLMCILSNFFLAR